jgi:hypothetical protein
MESLFGEVRLGGDHAKHDVAKADLHRSSHGAAQRRLSCIGRFVSF